MKYLIILFLFTSCATSKVFHPGEYCCLEVYSDMTEGITVADSLDRILFVIVLDESDSALKEKSVPELLQLTTKKDETSLVNLNRQYTVVQLTHTKLQAFITSKLSRHEHLDDYEKLAKENSSESYVFISAPKVLSIYSPEKLDQKAAITDLIHVGMGP